MEGHLFENRILVIDDGPEPININWENLDISNLERFIRRLGMYIVVLLVMGISTILLIYTNALSKQGTYTCPPVDYKGATPEML